MDRPYPRHPPPRSAGGNLGAAQVKLTEEDLARLNAVTSTVTVYGARGTGREQYS
jgi:hypothetical protein